LYADPASVTPHCASPLTLAKILVRRQCYNKQVHTCHIEGTFLEILAADRRITTKVLAFLLALKLPLDFDMFFHPTLMFQITLHRNFVYSVLQFYLHQ
jgi:hypothetical protein